MSATKGELAKLRKQLKEAEETIRRLDGKLESVRLLSRDAVATLLIAGTKLLPEPRPAPGRLS